MATKHIQALVGFHGVADGDVLKRGLNVVTNLTGNSKFPASDDSRTDRIGSAALPEFILARSLLWAATAIVLERTGLRRAEM